MYYDAKFPNYKKMPIPLLQDGRLSNRPCSFEAGAVVISVQVPINPIYQPSEQMYKEPSERSNSTPNPGRMPDSTPALRQPGLTFSSYAVPLLSKS